MSGLHSRLLQLLEGLSSLHALMLPDVANEQNLVLGTNLAEEISHLLCRCERGFIDHIEMLSRRVIALPIATRKETLQRIGFNARIAELAGGAGGRGETLDRITVLLRALTDAFKRSRFSSSRRLLAIPVSDHGK